MTVLQSAGVLLLLLAAPLAAAEPKAPRGAPQGKVERMIDFIKSNKGSRARKDRAPNRPEKVFSLTEDEVNAYVRSWIQDEAKRPRHKEVSVKSAEVRFEAGGAVEADAVAQVGVSSLKLLDSLGDSYFARMVKQSLTMDNTIHLKCLVSAADGKGALDVQEVRIKGVPVPASLVQQILKIVGEHQHPPQDYTHALALPNGIRKVEVRPRVLTLSVLPLS